MQTIQKITPVCQIENEEKIKKKKEKVLIFTKDNFIEILRKIECGELRLPAGESLVDDIESALNAFIDAKYHFKVKLVTDKQKASAKYAKRQVLLDNVRALKLRQFLLNENHFPSELELDTYQNYCYEAPLSPLCEQKAVFYNVLTKKRLPFTCHRLRCGCLKCAASAMENRCVKVSNYIFKYPALCRMISLTLDIKKIPGNTLDQKREYAWNCIIGDCREKFIRALRKYLKKRGVKLEKDFHYIWWSEPHKKPDSYQFPHVHILIDEYIDKELINKFARKSGFGIANITIWSDKSKIGKYTSKQVRDSIARYTSKSVVDSVDNADDDEKCFDRRALSYLLPRKRLIGFSRNLTKDKTEDTGLSAWSIMQGQSENLIASELVGKFDSKESPIYPSAYTSQLIGLWNYIAGADVKVKPSVAKIVEKARASNDKTIIINLATELARHNIFVEISMSLDGDKLGVINKTDASIVDMFINHVRRIRKKEAQEFVEKISDFNRQDRIKAWGLKAVLAMETVEKDKQKLSYLMHGNYYIELDCCK